MRWVLGTVLVFLLAASIRLEIALRDFDRQRQAGRLELEKAIERRDRNLNQQIDRLQKAVAERKALVERIDRLAKDLDQ